MNKSKADHHDNDAIVDDLAGQAYVEQFGTEIFSKAENAMKLSKATRCGICEFQYSGEDRWLTVQKADSRYLPCVRYLPRTLSDLGTSGSPSCFKNQVCQISFPAYCSSDQSWGGSEFVKPGSSAIASAGRTFA